MGHILVAYFSATGTTAKAANCLTESIGADIYEIEPAAPYTADDLNWGDKTSRTSLERSDPAMRPAINGRRDNMDDYATVFVGIPIWWYSAPRIINTFLESYDLSGKMVIPFATSEESGMDGICGSIAHSCPGAELKEGRRISENCSLQELSDWATNSML